MADHITNKYGSWENALYLTPGSNVEVQESDEENIKYIIKCNDIWIYVHDETVMINAFEIIEYTSWEERKKQPQLPTEKIVEEIIKEEYIKIIENPKKCLWILVAFAIHVYFYGFRLIDDFIVCVLLFYFFKLLWIISKVRKERRKDKKE